MYLAEAADGTHLAVRVVRVELAADPVFRARFHEEVCAARRIAAGPGTYLARIVDADTESEHPWIATEFIDGPDLREAVRRQGPLPEEAVRLLAAALGEALDAIHAQGLVHGGLDPSSVVLGADGPRIVDLGVSHMGGQVGPAEDVFALGSVLAYAASGRVPLQKDLSDLPDGVRDLVARCLSENPADTPAPPPTRRRTLQALAAGALLTAGAWLWLRDRDDGDGTPPEPEPDPLPPDPRPVTVQWLSRHGMLSGQLGSPAVTPSPDGDRLYFGAMDGSLYAVSRTGTDLWSTPVEKPRARTGPVTASVATDDGVYCVYRNGGRLCAVGVDGRVRWERVFDRGGYDSYDTLPVVARGLVLVTTDRFAMRSTVRAYRADGSVAWSTRLPGKLGQQPVVAEDVVYVRNDEVVFALDPVDGRLLPASGRDSATGWPPRFGGAVVVPPHTVLGDLVVSASSNELKAVDRDGRTVWTVEAPGRGAHSEPTVHGGLVHVLLGASLYVVDAGGVTRCVLDPGMPVRTEYRPVVDGRHVYLAVPEGVAAIERPR
ncbi:PQQ-binding-like beta-propeller repeat protein [Streptomyces sp. NPDC047072]|uniref:outer membrane protein assembly factor BamB family protein n=1 Tax=Streptomyces sp. NPDC047072 TaxID=3154809 RepID=UPI0033E87795